MNVEIPEHTVNMWADLLERGPITSIKPIQKNMESLRKKVESAKDLQNAIAKVQRHFHFDEREMEAFVVTFAAMMAKLEECHCESGTVTVDFSSITHDSINALRAAMARTFGTMLLEESLLTIGIWFIESRSEAGEVDEENSGVTEAE